MALHTHKLCQWTTASGTIKKSLGVPLSSCPSRVITVQVGDVWEALGVPDVESREPPAAQGGWIHRWPEQSLCNIFLKGQELILTEYWIFFFWASLKLTPNSRPANPLLTERDYLSFFTVGLSWWRKVIMSWREEKGHSVQHPWEGSWAIYWLVWSSKW